LKDKSFRGVAEGGKKERDFRRKRIGGRVKKGKNPIEGGGS